MRLLFLSSGLSISVLIRRLTWRPSWLKLLMVTTKRQSSSFSEASYSEEVDTGALACQLSILEGMIRRRRYHACFDEILLEV